MANGIGRLIQTDGTKYTGDWVNNNKEGFGLEVWIDSA